VGDSLTEDWDLVCEREGLRATLGAVPMAGYLIGRALTDNSLLVPGFLTRRVLFVTSQNERWPVNYVYKTIIFLLHKPGCMQLVGLGTNSKVVQQATST
jgi:hypothetical protein